MFNKRPFKALNTRISRLVWKRMLSPCCEVGSNVYIKDLKRLHVGRRFVVGDDTIIDFESNDTNISIGDNVQLSTSVFLDGTGGLFIGDNTLISHGVLIHTHSHGTNPRSLPVGMNKHIGKDVWIGVGAIVLEQVRMIGDGAIVGAGAVVTHDVPARTIVAGNPARIVRQL